MQWPGTELQQSEWFNGVQQSVIERRVTMSARDHVGHLSTISAYLVSPTGPVNSCTWTSRSSATSPTAGPQGPGPPGRPQDPLRGRLQLHPHRRRRPLPPRPQRNPQRREERDRHRLLDTRTRLLHRRRAHRRMGPDRQRRLLQVLPLARDPDGGRDRPQANPALPAADQPQGRMPSTAPCSTNGPTNGPTPRTTNGPKPWQTSSTPTTTTAATRHSADTHPSPASTTLRVNTASLGLS